MRYIIRLLFLCVQSVIVFAQSGNIDLTFNSGSGVNGTIETISLQPDGKIIIGGYFSEYNGFQIKNIARLNYNGNLDTTFQIGTGTNSVIYASVIQEDGKIIIGGNFTDYNGTEVNRIIRLNSNGTIDTGFNTGSGVSSGIIEAIALQPDGKIIVGGFFGMFNGITVNHLTRLHSDGTVDESFNQIGYLTLGANAGVYAGDVSTIVLDENGKIIIGGFFLKYNNIARKNIARLNSDGSLDQTFNPGAGTNQGVAAADIQSDGKIIIGGNFTTYNDFPVNYIARLNSDGNIDQTFNHNNGLNAALNSVKVDYNQKILVGGEFTSFGNNAVNYYTRLDSEGSQDTAFQVTSGANSFVETIYIQPDGRILLAGHYTEIEQNSFTGIARLDDCFAPQVGPVLGNTLVCPETNQIFNVEIVLGADSYTWILPNGWTGNSTTNIINIVPYVSGGIISVIANTNHCVSLSEQSIIVETPVIPEVPLCMVTVDSASTYNIIFWEKPITEVIDSFFVYKEIQSDNYLKIASVSYNSINSYHDFSANPGVTSFKYKISVLDTCGNESELSNSHNTIHLQHLGNGNLKWTLYEIENTLNPVVYYRVYRDDFGINNFSPVSTTISATNSTFTDVNFASYPNAKYFLDVEWSISCEAFDSTINTTRSNILNLSSSTLSELNNESYFYLYPNPIKNDLFLEINSDEVFDFFVVNNMGQIVLREKEIAPKVKNEKFIKHIGFQNQSPGIYYVHLYTKKLTCVKKIVVVK